MILIELCSIILWFQSHTFALATDTEKAFQHVKLYNSDQNETHFLWISDMTKPAYNLQT